MKLILLFFAVLGLSAAVPTKIFGSLTFNTAHRGNARSLKNDFDDFVALIPVDKLVALYHKYENDPDMKAIVAYMYSDEFKTIASIVSGVDEVKDLVSFIESKGVPIIEMLNKFADHFNLPHWPSRHFYGHPSIRSPRSLRSFLDEAEAMIPMNDIVELAVDKLANSEDFQDLYIMIASWDYQKLHDGALSHPEIVNMLNGLRSMGVDVDKAWETIKNIFNWQYSAQRRSSRSLKNDFDDFLALIPVDKLVDLYHKYENDPDMKTIVAYMYSDEFKTIASIVSGVAEVKDLVSFIDSKGVPIIDMLNKFADHFNLPHWSSRYYLGHPSIRSSRSLVDFIDEAMAIIPINDIVQLAVDKLANSEDFQELYLKIASWDYQKLHDGALSHPEIVNMLNGLKKMGINVEQVWETIKQVFGWQYSAQKRHTRSLKNDFDDFVALIPVDKLVELYHKYENDPDIKTIVAYMYSDEFKTIASIVSGVDEVKDLVSFINDKGVPIIDMLNKFADHFNLPHWPSVYYFGRPPIHSTRSLRGFLDEAEAIIPMDAIVQLAVDKLANSEDFQELYMKIAGWDYQKLHDGALSHPEIVNMLNGLRSMGIDVDKVWETIKTVFGWV